jgi:hypothetical protein
MGAIPLADNAYLKRRRGKRRSGFRWYVRVPVPTDIQEIVRKQTIERALNTSAIKEARKLKLTVLAQIFKSFERAHRITSSDIEHEAQRYLRDRMEQVAKNSDDTFTMLMDANGNDIELAGDSVLATLRQELEQEDWSSGAVQEADKIARQYGVTPTKAQRDELCRALHLAEIEALSRALSIHAGTVPEPITVLNARAVDPFAASFMSRQAAVTRLPRNAVAPGSGDRSRLRGSPSAMDSVSF